jgi:hypothetical protein
VKPRVMNELAADGLGDALDRVIPLVAQIDSNGANSPEVVLLEVRASLVDLG